MAEKGDDKKVTKVIIDYTEHIHKPDNEVILFHVSDRVVVPSYAFDEESIMTLTYIDDVKREVERSKRKNKEIEEKYDEKCKALQMKYRFLLVSEDDSGPGHAIVEAAKKLEAHLIVVGSRGQGIIKRTILGSVSSYVIHHGHIPALVCPPK